MGVWGLKKDGGDKGFDGEEKERERERGGLEGLAWRGLMVVRWRT